MIILTGASGGIGKKIIENLSNSNEIIGIYNKSNPSLIHDNVFYEKVDLQDPKNIKEFIKKWKKKLSNVTVIHGAVKSIDNLAVNCTEQDWDEVMNVNLKGNFFLTQALLPIMIAQKWGRIISISSVVGQSGSVGTAAYSTSKTALTGITNVLATEYGRYNITANVLVLGYFKSGLINTLNKNKKEEILNKIPSKKFGDIENISNAINFIISSNYVNGSQINIDGGISH